MSLRGARRRAAGLGPLGAWLVGGLLLWFVALAVRETRLALTTGSPLAPARAGYFWVLAAVAGVGFYSLLLRGRRGGAAEGSGRPPGRVAGVAPRRGRRRPGKRAASRRRRRASRGSA